MRAHELSSHRLSLIPVSVASCTAELKENRELSHLLNADVPGDWPPPLVTTETLHEFIGMLTDPVSCRLCAWYWVLNSDEKTRRPVLIGSGGLFITEDGTCEIGYSVLEAFQCLGYATEAVGTILDFVFSQGDIRTVYATTYPHLYPSVRVLQKNGFIPDGPGREEGTVRFLVQR